MKKIRYIIYGITTLTVAILLSISIMQGRHLKSCRNQISSQQTIIDSLMNIERNSVNIELYVTDRSVNKIYGRYNKGSISMPNEKTYTLDVDSVKLFKTK